MLYKLSIILFLLCLSGYDGKSIRKHRGPSLQWPFKVDDFPRGGGHGGMIGHTSAGDMMAREHNEVTPKEKLMSPDEMMMSPDERMMPPDEKMMSSDEMMMSPDEMMMSPDEMMMSPDEMMMSPDEMMMSPDEMMMKPDKMMMSPDEMMMSPDEMMMSPDEMMMSPNKKMSSDMCPMCKGMMSGAHHNHNLDPKKSSSKSSDSDVDDNEPIAPDASEEESGVFNNDNESSIDLDLENVELDLEDIEISIDTPEWTENAVQQHNVIKFRSHGSQPDRLERLRELLDDLQRGHLRA